MNTPKRRVAKPRTHADGPRIKWSEFRPMYDYWGRELKRFYQLDTLSNAVDLYIRTKDRFIIQSIQAHMGPAPITRLHFTLFQEGRYQLIFRLDALNTLKQRASFAFVAAKNHQECSTVAAAEHRNLTLLNERAPAHVVKPFRGGLIYLPDRHKRPDQVREIFAYLTQWLPDYDELGVHKNLQFIVNVKPHHMFSVVESEKLRGIIVEIIASTFDPRLGTCMEMPEIASGDFVVKAGARGRLYLKLIACRRMQNRIRPAKLIDQIMDANWRWGSSKLRLAPDNMETLFEALARAHGPEAAKEWVKQYLTAVRAKKFPDRRPGSLEALEQLVVQ
jgi:hypothetical protein